MLAAVDDHAAHARSFGPAAEIYERGRPPYPEAALDWLLPGPVRRGSDPDPADDRPLRALDPAVDRPSRAIDPAADLPLQALDPAADRPSRAIDPAADLPLRVLDLGAGTGKLTRQLAARGLDVVAVDPSEGMLAEYARVVPGIPALRGSAEDIPLPDGSVDVVLMASAWHWVDPERAVPEIARVLSPGGRLGVLWNVRDDRSGWIRRLEEIIGRADHHRHVRFRPPFGPVQTCAVPWTHQIGPEVLLDLVASRSHVILLPPVERAALLARVRQLSITHPDLVGRTEYEMPFVTQCARASLTGRH